MSFQEPFRAIVARFSYPISMATMENVLQQIPFEFCGIISVGDDPQYFKGLPQEKQEWFCSAKIRSGVYEGVDWNNLAPLDETIVEQMRDTEAIFLENVTRLEWKREIPFEVRKRWYYDHLRFWNDYISRHNINLYLSAWIPHELPDVIIYRLCKLRGIPVLYFHTSSMRDTSFAEHSWEDSAAQIGVRYEELLREYTNVTDPAQIPLNAEFEERYGALTLSAGQRPPVEGVRRPTELRKIKELLLKKPLTFLIRALQYLTPSGLRRAAMGLRIWRVLKERNAFYDAHAVVPDMNVPFVYLPLHFQPEASTTPMGGVYTDQMLIARMLNALLPEGVLIYVKEHPRESAWVSRSVQYYKDFLELPKVRLIARSVDTFDLRERCSAVATVTGTAGFEALFRGKPVFLFGYRFFQYARGVFRIRTKEDCAQAIQKIFQEHAALSLTESRLYLKAMEETCVRGSLNPWHLKVTKLSDEEHVEANTKAIIQELQMMQPQ